MVCEDTLRIKNLPPDLSDAEKKDFVHYFGATQIKVITSYTKQKSVVYAKFESKDVAKSVLFRLHQLSILNSRLCVEYAEHDLGGMLPKLKTKESLEPSNKKHFKSFMNKLNAFNSSVSFNQPPPSHLKYIYPKPNRATLNNIAHALASVPKFYTQVLHLMNRMNLPPPFSDIPDPPQVPVRPVMSAIPPQQMVRPNVFPPPHQEVVEKKAESSESELESDAEGSDKHKEVIPTKRLLPQKKTSVKRPKFIKPPVIQPTTSTKPIEHAENVFEKVHIQQQKKIELIVSADTLEQKEKEADEQPGLIGTFGLLESAQELENQMEMQEEMLNIQGEEKFAEAEQKEESNPVCISDEDLAANRIELKDLSVVPVFKNYHPGAPTCRLYIKNIAKSVETKDLEFIFKRYYVEKDDPESPSQFDIRLMQEGRMKGQAFVTLDDIELAQKALKETNGYILKDRPMVVVFARSALPKK